ncbi:stalk domain-containing protein [Paenibacillus chitinolyticus]
MHMPSKKMIAAAAGVLMSVSFAAGVYADDWIQKVTAYVRSDFKVVVNGTPANLSSPVLIYDNNSYLPLKEIASRLNANVNWQDSNQTIYVNTRLYPQQPETGDVVYDEIILENPTAYIMKYLGGDYPVLVTLSKGMYYRQSDVQKMGMDTKGLRKAKEKYTGEIYINETELRKVWKENPILTYGEEMPPIIAGEKDDFKIRALRGYVKDMSNYKIGDTYFFHNPIFIEKLEEANTYRYLLTENGQYYQVILKLTEMQKDLYIVGSSSKQLLGKTAVDPY